MEDTRMPTAVFFRLMVRPKFLAALEKQLTMCCRASSMWVRKTVISKQQLSDEFLDGFHVFREMPKIKETAVCSEADVDAVWQVLFFASRSMMLKKMENNVEARMQPCLTPLEMGKLPDRDLLHFTFIKSNDR